MKKSIILFSILTITLLISCRQNNSNTNSKTFQIAQNDNNVTTMNTTPITTIESITTTKPILVEQLIADSNQIELHESDSVKLNYSIVPKDIPIEYTQIQWSSSDTSIAIVDDFGNVTGIENGICTVTATSINNPNVLLKFTITVRGKVKGSIKSTTIVLPNRHTLTTKETQTTEDKLENIIEITEPIIELQPTFINGILLVNNSYPLPHSYAPSRNLVSGDFGVYSYVQEAFNIMCDDAYKEGLSLNINRGYVSYDAQYEMFENLKNTYGIEYTDTIIDQASYSESQTGLSILLNSADEAFNDTSEATWIAQNCYKYGFIVRYPQGKEDITGKSYRSFQLRYVGIDVATEMFNQGICLEEYLGL